MLRLKSHRRPMLRRSASLAHPITFLSIQHTICNMRTKSEARHLNEKLPDRVSRRAPHIHLRDTPDAVSKPLSFGSNIQLVSKPAGKITHNNNGKNAKSRGLCTFANNGNSTPWVSCTVFLISASGASSMFPNWLLGNANICSHHKHMC